MDYSKAIRITPENVEKYEYIEPTWRVVGRLAARDRALFYGPPGCYKTWLLLDLTVAMAWGRPWLNHEVISGPALVFDQEMPYDETYRRMKLLSPPTGVPFIHPYLILNSSVFGFSGHRRENLITFLRNEGAQYHLAIFDSLRRHGVKENDQEQVSRMWDFLGEHCSPNGTTTIINHHLTKTNKDNADLPMRERASGSGDLTGGCDVPFSIIGSDNGLGGILTVEKMRRKKKPEITPFRFCTDHEPNPTRAWFEVAENPAVSFSEACRMAILAAFGTTIPGVAIPRYMLVQEAGGKGLFSEDVLRHAFNSLINEGKILKVATGLFTLPPRTP